MARKWAEVYNDERYQSLDEGEKARAKVGYFNEVVRPNIADPSELPAARQEFFSYANGLEAPKQEGVYDGLVKPIAKAPFQMIAAPVKAGLNMLSGIVSRPVAGYVGMASQGAGEDLTRSNKFVTDIQDAVQIDMTGNVYDRAVQGVVDNTLGQVGKGVEWIGEKGRELGAYAEEKTGIPYLEPLAATAAQGAAEVGLLLTGPKIARGISKGVRTVKDIGKMGEGLSLDAVDTPTVPVRAASSVSLDGLKRYMSDPAVSAVEKKSVLQSMIDKTYDKAISPLDEYLAPKIGAVEGETFAHRTQRVMQDSKVTLKEWEEQHLSGLPKEESAYYAEERMHGKIADDLLQAEMDIYKPFVKDAAEVFGRVGGDIDEAGLYLHAKHAPRRNEIIRGRNEQEIVNAYNAGDLARAERLESLGSGMSDMQAGDIIQRIKDSGKQADYDRLGDYIYKANERKLEIMEKSGLLSQEQAAALRAEHGPEYVPFKGKAGVESTPGKGSGLSVRSTGLQEALGRTSQAENPIIHTLNDLDSTIRRARQNEVGNAFLKLAETLEDPSIQINKPLTKRRLDTKTGQIEEYNAGTWAPTEMPENVFSTIKNGEHYDIRINDNPLLVKALKTDNAPVGKIMEHLGKATRTMSSMVTRWDPQFVFSNAFRDMFDSVQALGTENSAAVAAKAAKSIPGAAKAMFEYGRTGKSTNAEWAPYVKGFTEGGQSGFYSQLDFDAKMTGIQKAIQVEQAIGLKDTTLKRAGQIGGFLNDFVSAGENATRLAAYRALVDNGVSHADALSKAKNVTLNFNRRGEQRALSAAYMFVNPSIQSIARIKQLVSTSRGRAVMAGLTEMAREMNEVNRVIGGEDEQGNNNYDKLSKFDRSRNIIIMNPTTGKPAAKIPIGFYARLPFAAANIGYELKHGLSQGSKAAMDAFDVTMDAFNPIGGSQGAAALAPTVVKPFVDVWMNKNFAGQPIKPQQPLYGGEKPNSQLAFKSVSPVSKVVAEKMNESSGGNQFKKGLVDISPESIDHVVKSFTGGPGRILYQLIALGAKGMDTDKDVISVENLNRMLSDTTLQEIPIVGKFFGADTRKWKQGKFYEIADEASQKLAEIEGMGRTDGDMSQYTDKDMELAGLGRQVSEVRSQLSEISKAIEAVKADNTLTPTERRAELKDLEAAQDEMFQVVIDARKEIK